MSPKFKNVPYRPDPVSWSRQCDPFWQMCLLVSSGSAGLAKINDDSSLDPFGLFFGYQSQLRYGPVPHIFLYFLLADDLQVPRFLVPVKLDLGVLQVVQDRSVVQAFGHLCAGVPSSNSVATPGSSTSAGEKIPHVPMGTSMPRGAPCLIHLGTSVSLSPPRPTHASMIYSCLPWMDKTGGALAPTSFFNVSFHSLMMFSSNWQRGVP